MRHTGAEQHEITLAAEVFLAVVFKGKRSFFNVYQLVVVYGAREYFGASRQNRGYRASDIGVYRVNIKLLHSITTLTRFVK